MTSVPFVDLRPAHDEIRDELDAAASRVLAASSFILGEEVDAFEAEFARYCGVRHCIGVGTGLDALYLILRAMEIGPGDEVIVPAHTFIATWLAVFRTPALLWCQWSRVKRTTTSTLRAYATPSLPEPGRSLPYTCMGSPLR